MISDKKIFRSGLYADYLNLETKDEDVLYFCTDTKQIFKGTIDVTQEYQQVYNKPDDPAVGVLYASSENGTVETYNGTSWVEVFAPIVGTDTVYSVPLPEGETSVTLPMPDEGDVVDIYTDNSAQYTSIEVNEATRTRSANNTGSLTVNFAQQEISDIVHMRTYHNDRYTASILASLCIDSISITHPADNTVFINGEVFDITGLQVAAIQGSEQIDITNSITTVPAVGTKLKNTGVNSVRIIYGTLETSYNINVISIDEIEVTTLPTKTVYVKNESLDLTGIVVTGYNSDRSVSRIITNDCKFIPPNGTVLTNEDTYVINVKYNNISTSFSVRVLPPVPEIYNTVRNASTVSESDWIEFVNSDCIKSVIDRDDTEAFIGKTVNINNSKNTRSTAHEILDFNHDNSGNTCDLIALSSNFNVSAEKNKMYQLSYRRFELLEFIQGYSTNIQNMLYKMDVVQKYLDYNDKVTIRTSYVYDKVKLLSGSEMGATYSYMYTDEGTKYPRFTASPADQKNSTRVFNNYTIKSWIRSDYERYPYIDAWSIYCSDGNMYAESSVNTSLSVNPVVRFKKPSSITLETASWEYVRNAVKNGTIFDFAMPGDTKSITINGQTYHMQLVSVNDGTGDAGEYYPAGTADFVSVELFAQQRQVNSTNTNIGGWRDCELRPYLNTDIYNILPDDVKNVIVEKTHMYNQGGANSALLSASDKLWLPTLYEVESIENSRINIGETSSSNKTYHVISGELQCSKYRNGTKENWLLASVNRGYSTETFIQYGSNYYGRDLAAIKASANTSFCICFRIG